MLDPTLVDAVRAAAERRVMPGGIAWRILLPDAVGRIAADLETARWQVELAALDNEIVPLHYVRNIARFAIRGQIALLRGRVAIVAGGPAARKCLELLALAGVGELRIFSLAGLDPADAPQLAEHARRLNASVRIEAGFLDLRRGDPSEPLAGVDVVACCLEQAMDEGLLQSVCRRLKAPLVCAAVQDSRAQATTALPGDPGLARIYRAETPHLDKERPGTTFGEGKAPSVAGAWMAEQCLHLLLGDGEVLHNRMLYADLYEGEMETYPL
jgi:molybdopterin/thiamine biosynthesis adenylyltransferase